VQGGFTPQATEGKFRPQGGFSFCLLLLHFAFTENDLFEAPVCHGHDRCRQSGADPKSTPVWWTAAHHTQLPTYSLKALRSPSDFGSTPPTKCRSAVLCLFGPPVPVLYTLQSCAVRRAVLVVWRVCASAAFAHVLVAVSSSASWRTAELDRPPDQFGTFFGVASRGLSHVTALAC
jgi:hypothetical protein